MKQFILLITLLHCTFLLTGLEYEPLIGKLQIYDFAKEPRSLITFLRDSAGNKFVVKQYRYERAGASFATLIADLVALDVGHSLGISVNHACLLPADLEFLGKDKEAPATLHVHVPGMPFTYYMQTHEQSLYDGLEIEQKFKPYGLTRSVMYHMSRHKDLPPMVALDTFVCNGGRLPHNYFYDELQDRFYGIDMASSFGRNLCRHSVANVTKLISKADIKFSEAELSGLKSYYQTFKQLVQLHSPEYLCSQLDIYTQRAGLLSPTFFDKKVQTRCLELLIERKEAIHASAADARELIKLLKTFLFKHGVSA